MIQDILEKSNEQFLQKLWKSGLLSYKIFFYRNLWIEHDLQLKMGMSKMDAIHNTATKFNVCYMTVYRALRIMDSNYNEKKG